MDISMTQNPFLQETEFPQFDKLHVEHIQPAIDFLIANNLKEIESLVADKQQPTWNNFVEKLELLDNHFEKV